MTPRKVEVVGEHSIAVLPATPSGYVLDAGCRDFVFAREMANRGHTVIALDPDPVLEPPENSGIVYERVAVAATRGRAKFEMCADPQARRISERGTETVDCVTIQDIMRLHWISKFRIVKLDIEGSEYAILESWPGPIADQITVEFHEHVCPQPPSRYEKILTHLGQWYDLVSHEKTARHGAGMNYWDSLWVLRDLR